MNYKQLKHKPSIAYPFKYFPCIEQLVDYEGQQIIEIERKKLDDLDLESFERKYEQKRLDEFISKYAAKSFIEKLLTKTKKEITRKGELEYVVKHSISNKIITNYILSRKIAENHNDASMFLKEIVNNEFMYYNYQYTGFWEDTYDKNIMKTFKITNNKSKSNEEYKIAIFKYP